MKRTFLPILVIVGAALAAYGQTSAPRIVDNFDMSRGVRVYLPPVPPPAIATTSKKKKGKRGQVVADAGAARRPVTRTGLTAAVSDGLAQRDALTTFTSPKLTMGTSTHLKGFTTGNIVHDAYIVESSRRYGIDPLLIYAQMHQESSFKINARSHKGASGLMQLMPGTARRFGVTSIYDPRQNIDAGVRYMRWLLDTFRGDVVLALAGYNAGEGAVMKYGWSVPPYSETREYVRRITSRYNSISDGRFIHTARSIKSQSGKLVQKDSRPLWVYEPSVLAVRTADGRMMLMNQ